MASLQSLPYDLIYHIFSTDYISAFDLLNLSSVCQVFNCVANDNALWRNKFKKKWPDCMSLFMSTSDCWKTLFKWRSYCEIKVRQKLFDLSTDCYYVENIEMEAIGNFYDVVHKHPRNFSFILDELQMWMESKRQDHLTEKFYASRLWRYMHIMHLESTCLDYIKHPERSSVFEAATLACMWFELFEPKNTEENANKVKEIAKRVVNRVQELYPDHPMNHLFEHDWKVPEETVWGTIHCKQILESIYEVMFGVFNFQVDDSEADCFSVGKALEKCKGTKEILVVIFSEIALLLGILVHPINMTEDFRFKFLKWKPNPKHCPGEVYYMDLDNGWISKGSSFMNSINPHSEPKEPEYKPLMVFIILAAQAIRFLYGSFLRNYVQMQKAMFYFSLASDYLQSDTKTEAFLLFEIVFSVNIAGFLLNARDVRPTTVVSLLQAATPADGRLLRRKFRNKKLTNAVKYAIGMLMKHKRRLYRCVIYGWEVEPCGPWFKFTNPLREFQPHYKVLLDGDIVGYVAQGDLKMDNECTPINSIKVGKYFKSFEGNYYEPIKKAKLEYPDDARYREEALQAHRNRLRNEPN